MTDNLKVLVTGSAHGQFKALFAKVKQIHEKYGPFQVHLCVGDFFGPDTSSIQELLDNQIEVPLTTYFLHGQHPFPEPVQQHLQANDGELCQNLYYLGKQGVLTTSEGLKMAFLSGQHDSPETGYTTEDIQKLSKMSSNGIDFLLTHEWPKGIEQKSQQSITLEDQKSHALIAQLATALKPRYHFAASQAMFFEREPYQNGSIATRFIGLANVLNEQKQRWFYAFNLVPSSKLDGLEVPENTTDCPFDPAGEKRALPETEQENYFWQDNNKRTKTNQPPPGYVCKRCKVEGHYIKDCPTSQSGPPDGYVCKICQGTGHYITQCPQQSKAKLDACWFCLANPNLEKHLIVSIGSELYVTLAKGPVVTSNHPDCKVPGEGHALIIPITHYPTFGQVPPDSQKEVMTELIKYKSALRTLFQQYDQDMMVFEVSRDSQRGLAHAHLQVVPIPKSKSDQVEKVARELGVAAHIEFVDKVPSNPEIPYFKLDLPNGKSLIHIIQPRERFNLQFGRLVAATVLGSPEREDWKACGQTEEEERKNATLFKEAFQPYDFSLK